MIRRGIFKELELNLEIEDRVLDKRHTLVKIGATHAEGD